MTKKGWTGAVALGVAIWALSVQWKRAPESSADAVKTLSVSLDPPAETPKPVPSASPLLSAESSATVRRSTENVRLPKNTPSSPRPPSDLEIARAKWEEKNRMANSGTMNSSDSPSGNPVPLDRLGGSGRKDRRENALGWFDTSRTPTDYRVGISVIPGEGNEPVAFIEARSGNPRPWGSLAYVVDLDRAIGSEVRVSALVKAEQVDSGIFWATASGENFEQIAYGKKQFFQTFHWRRLEVVLRVPATTRKFQFGITLDGRRRILIKDVRFTGK